MGTINAGKHSMNILLITLGSRGDVNPFIDVGLMLKNRGHAVTVVTSEVYANVITALGLDFISCNTAAEYNEIINNPDLYHPRKGFAVFAEYAMLNPMRKEYDIISQFNSSNTLLVATQFMLGARLANEKLGFPLVTVALQPASFWSIAQPPLNPGALYLPKFPYVLRKLMLKFLERNVIDRTLCPQLNQLRVELGLAPVNRIYSQWLFSPRKIIGLFPEWFAHPAVDWPAQTQLTGFIHHNENADQTLPEKVSHFLQADSPPLVLTYGTATTQGNYFFQVFIEAARKLKLRVLILTQYPEQLPPLQPEREIQVNYASLPKIFPHAAALVHHGGIGTLSQALTAGLPQLIVPMAYDQFDNASRLNQIGAGLSLTTKNYSISAAVNKIEKLLQSPEIKSNCLHYSKRIDFSQAGQLTCQLLEATR